MTLIIVPLVAQFILDCIYWVNGTFWGIVTDLDEHSVVMDKIELFIEGVRDAIAAKLPRIVVYSYHKLAVLLEKVPESVWNTGTFVCWMRCRRTVNEIWLPRVFTCLHSFDSFCDNNSGYSRLNVVPLTLISCVLGCLAVPYIIFKIDDYFQALADKKKEDTVEAEEES